MGITGQCRYCRFWERYAYAGIGTCQRRRHDGARIGILIFSDDEDPNADAEIITNAAFGCYQFQARTDD